MRPTFRWVNFSEAQFGWVAFDKARFAGESVFFNTSFTETAIFNEIKFRRAAFDGAEFASDVFFDGARFVRAEFDRVQFGDSVSFSNAHFLDDADSVGTSIPTCVKFDGATFAHGVPQEVAPWKNGLRRIWTKWGRAQHCVEALMVTSDIQTV